MADIVGSYLGPPPIVSLVFFVSRTSASALVLAGRLAAGGIPPLLVLLYFPTYYSIQLSYVDCSCAYANEFYSSTSVRAASGKTMRILHSILLFHIAPSLPFNRIFGRRRTTGILHSVVKKTILSYYSSRFFSIHLI